MKYEEQTAEEIESMRRTATRPYGESKEQVMTRLELREIENAAHRRTAWRCFGVGVALLTVAAAIGIGIIGFIVVPGIALLVAAMVKAIAAE